MTNPPTEPSPDLPTVEAEFLVEPFIEGSPGPHVLAAFAAVEEAGLAVEVGPFGNVVSGPLPVVTGAIDRMLRAAVAAGSTRVQLQLRTIRSR